MEAEKLTMLNIGCGKTILPNHVNLDKMNVPGIDVTFDLEDCDYGGQLPFPDDFFDEVKAFHVLEHINNILPLMQELHRVTKPEGVMMIRVPYGSTNSAFDDPTHIRQFFPKSFGYFGQPYYHRADYGYRGDWKIDEIAVTIYKKLAESFVEANIDLSFALDHMNNIVAEMLCKLVCVKPIREPLFELQEAVGIQIVLLEEEGEDKDEDETSH